MNDLSDISSTQSLTPDNKPCGFNSIIPNLRMASCRDRAEAFARSLSSKLRTLGSQSQNVGQREETPDGNSSSKNNWLTSDETEKRVTDTQPLRNESDTFFDFECELESPGSPIDECVYLQLIETATASPHNPASEPNHINTSSEELKQISSECYATNPMTHNKLSIISSSTSVEFLGSENYLKVNGSIQNNGHYTNGADVSSISDIDAPPPVEHKRSMPLPDVDHKMLPDENTFVEKIESEIKNHNLFKEMVDIQDKIISELQRQSEQVSENLQTFEKANDTCGSNHLSASALEDRDSTEVNVSSNTTEVATELQQNSPPSGELTKDFLTSASKEEQNLKDNLQIEKTTSEQDSTAQDQKLTKKENFGQCHHPVLETDDEDDCRPQRVRRCSSLKTGKTPPGTPSRKKIVRFADVLGLDLADIKTFLDEVPTIPKSAFEDLEIMESEAPIQFHPKSDKLLIPLFQQPASLPTFLDTVNDRQVSLENAAISDPVNQTITGTIRVRNLDFHKSAYIRYSLDGWRSFADLQANYVPNSCDGFSDKFSFVLFGNSLQIGQRLEFAVRFQCKGQQFWDNNYGMNYCFQCVPTTSQLTTNTNLSLASHHSNHMTGGFLGPNTGGDCGDDALPPRNE